MNFLLIFCLFISNALAGIDKVAIEDLEMEYLAPKGIGSVNKISVGTSLVTGPYPIEILRTEDTFELLSPYFDYSWGHPPKFIYQIEKLISKNTDIILGKKIGHLIESDYLLLSSEERGEYIGQNLKGRCEGSSDGLLLFRLLDDCRTELNLTIKKLTLPPDFFLYRILEYFPRLPGPRGQSSGDHLMVQINEGNYDLKLNMKHLFYADIHSTGYLQYEDNYTTLAIRVDSVKFAFLNVTKIFLNNLKLVLTEPGISIEPPWIRIKVASK